MRLLAHLEAYAHAIIIIGDATYSIQGSATAKLAQCLNKSQELLLLEEEADAIGSLGGKTRHTQDKSLHLDGMSLLIKGIVSIPRLAINLGIESTIGIECEISV